MQSNADVDKVVVAGVIIISYGCGVRRKNCLSGRFTSEEPEEYRGGVRPIVLHDRSAGSFPPDERF